MLLQREEQFVARDAAAVVDHPEEIAPAGADLDRDPARARVERVLQQFLDGGGGALHHLAGGDLSDEIGGEEGDRHRAGLSLPS